MREVLLRILKYKVKKMVIHLNLGEKSYDIAVSRGALKNANEHFNLNRRVFIITDSGVPSEYAKTLASLCKKSFIFTVNQGEGSKSFETLQEILKAMLESGLSRKDCVIAVGGGVVGDLSGFAASVYMRGIDFYNVPTTVLSQIDSSIGGKTAINFNGVKNVIGAFYQPKKVLIDPELLLTLDERQFLNGIAEAIKMALTSDETLFDILESQDIKDNIDEIIIRSLNVKKSVVEEDEKEAGVRKILNFGHTVGHGIESAHALYHGECVALGMLPMCDGAIRKRVINVLKKCNLYREINYDWEKIKDAASFDKKADGELVTVTTVSKIGSYEMKTVGKDELIAFAKKILEEIEK